MTVHGSSGDLGGGPLGQGFAEPFITFPKNPPAEVILGVRDSGRRCITASTVAEADSIEPDETEDGWGGSVVVATEGLSEAIAFCRGLRKREQSVRPLLLVIDPSQLEDLALREDLFDDFCLSPASHQEVTARIEMLLRRAGQGVGSEMIEFGPIEINAETYQAAVGGEIMNLTFMEFELLKFLVTHPAKVFSRETLLNRVWGYEYYGGARTVDVHIRRLRAKLGEEHAHFIQTVRSVGYRFGHLSWTPGAGE
ncbi:MAG: response regulator transcription factor [Actinomycetes bacterium]